MFRPRATIDLPADLFESGHANTRHHPFGQGLIVDGGKRQSRLAWRFEVSRPGTYHLQSAYAALDSRPVRLSLDGRLLVPRGLARVTGGWDARSVRRFIETEVFLERGPHRLELETPDFIPHIRAFRFIEKNGRPPRPRISLWEKLSDLADWHPYRTPRPGLLRKALSHWKSHGTGRTLLRAGAYCLPRAWFQREYAEALGVFTRHAAFKGPQLVQIDLSNRCNNQCIGCWCHSPLLGEQRMPESLKNRMLPASRVLDLLEELGSMGTREIYYSGGGEPFTHPDILSILEKTKRLGMVAYVNTNFTLLNEPVLDRLMALGVDHLTVSVWAGTANGYVATHPKRSPGDFYRLRERLAYLNRNKNRVPYTKVYHVLSKKNAAEFRALFNFALDTRSDSVEFALLDPIPGKTDCLLLDEEELAALKKDALELRRRVEDSGLDRRITLFGYDDFLRRIEDGVRASRGYYDHRAVEEIPCTIGWTFSRINADGEVNGCLKSHRLPLGNVLETRFSEIWNGPRQREFRTRTLERRPNDPFFRKIGNDTECAEGCMKSCDDIGRNLALHRKLQALSLPVRTALAVMAWPYRRGILPPRRPAPFRGAGKDDPAPAAPSSALAGYRDGQKAFTGPAAVALDVTNRCRARCLPCFTRSPLLHRDRPPSEWHERELPQSRVFELFEELESMGTRELRFSGGGDPLAHPEIASMVAGAKRRKFKVSITTALFRPHPETWERIVHTAPPEINVSLLAATPETYIRQHPGATARDFEWILGQVSRLAAAGKTRIVLTQVLNKGNLHEIRRMADLARELNVFAVHFTPMDAVCPELVPLALTGADLEQVSRELRRAASSITRRSSLRIEGGERFRPPGKASQPPPPCSVGWHFCRVLASGDVVPCCKAPRWILGNLYDNTFSDIWHGERYADFRVRSRRPECFPESFAGLECASRCDNAADNLHFYLEHIRPGTK